MGPKQYIIAELKRGDEIKVKGIHSYRMPAGLYYSYECMHTKTNLKFDLGFDMIDSITPKD